VGFKSQQTVASWKKDNLDALYVSAIKTDNIQAAHMALLCVWKMMHAFALDR